MVDSHVVLVCVLAIAFVIVVSRLGDKPRKVKRKPTYSRANVIINRYHVQRGEDSKR